MFLPISQQQDALGGQQEGFPPAPVWGCRCGRKEPGAAVDVYFKKPKSYTGIMMFEWSLKNTEVTEITPSCARTVRKQRIGGAPTRTTSPGGLPPPHPEGSSPPGSCVGMGRNTTKPGWSWRKPPLPDPGSRGGGDTGGLGGPRTTRCSRPPSAGRAQAGARPPAASNRQVRAPQPAPLCPCWQRGERLGGSLGAGPAPRPRTGGGREGTWSGGRRGDGFTPEKPTEATGRRMMGGDEEKQGGHGSPRRPPVIVTEGKRGGKATPRAEPTRPKPPPAPALRCPRREFAFFSCCF